MRFGWLGRVDKPERLCESDSHAPSSFSPRIFRCPTPSSLRSQHLSFSTPSHRRAHAKAYAHRAYACFHFPSFLAFCVGQIEEAIAMTIKQAAVDQAAAIAAAVAAVRKATSPGPLPNSLQ